MTSVNPQVAPFWSRRWSRSRSRCRRRCQPKVRRSVRYRLARCCAASSEARCRQGTMCESGDQGKFGRRSKRQACVCGDVIAARKMWPVALPSSVQNFYNDGSVRCEDGAGQPQAVSGSISVKTSSSLASKAKIVATSLNSSSQHSPAIRLK